MAQSWEALAARLASNAGTQLEFCCRTELVAAQVLKSQFHVEYEWNGQSQEVVGGIDDRQNVSNGVICSCHSNKAG